MALAAGPLLNLLWELILGGIAAPPAEYRKKNLDSAGAAAGRSLFLPIIILVSGALALFSERWPVRVAAGLVLVPTSAIVIVGAVVSST